MQVADFISAPSIWELLEKRVQSDPDKIFLIDVETGAELSFREFQQQVVELASRLFAAGVTSGKVAAWQMHTSIEAILTMFALARLGAVQVPMIHAYREIEVGEIISQSQADFIVVPSRHGGEKYQDVAEGAVALLADTIAKPRVLTLDTLDDETAEQLLPGFLSGGGEDVHWYFFTSGTTSRPKGARHTDHSLMTAAHFYGTSLEVIPTDVGSLGFPIAHIGGIINCVVGLMVGMQFVLFKNFTPDKVVEPFRRYGITHGGGGTAHCQILLSEQIKQPGEPVLPSLKALIAGGAAKPSHLYHQIKEQLGVKLIQAFGMTEAPISTCGTPDCTDEQLAQTDGVPNPALEVRIVDGAGRVVAPGEQGEILLKGPNLCKGYLLPEQTADGFDAEGFIHTGDLGILDKDNHLSITGRIKDIIIRKGENISAKEIEDLLGTHPKVGDVAVIGLPDDERGELVCAVIEAPENSEPLGFTEMVDYLKGKQLMRQKIPERLEVMAELPRNETFHKVIKNDLRKRFAGIT